MSDGSVEIKKLLPSLLLPSPELLRVHVLILEVVLVLDLVAGLSVGLGWIVPVPVPIPPVFWRSLGGSVDVDILDMAA